tara:strand:- start:8162 stop:8299 length:138 start_codon:yes stop_codon:yes gene_type:complete
LTAKLLIIRRNKMNGYGMGFGGIWMILVLILAVLAIAALIKYLRK